MKYIKLLALLISGLIFMCASVYWAMCLTYEHGVFIKHCSSHYVTESYNKGD